MLGGLTGDALVDMRAPEATGRARAVQGAPLVEVLTAYRVGFVEVWSALVAVARALRGVSSEVMVDLAGVIFALQNAYCDALVSAYRDESQQLVRARERERVLHLLNRHATGPIGASPIFVELRQAAWALGLARLAMGSHPGGAGVEQFRDSPLGMLVAAAPHAALEIARTILGDLLELPPDDRDLLLRTFDTWVEAEGSANAAGAVLFCHPNTVRYRLRRIETTTGRALSNPADVAELVTAARAWSHLPHPS